MARGRHENPAPDAATLLTGIACGTVLIWGIWYFVKGRHAPALAADDASSSPAFGPVDQSGNPTPPGGRPPGPTPGFKTAHG